MRNVFYCFEFLYSCFIFCEWFTSKIRKSKLLQMDLRHGTFSCQQEPINYVDHSYTRWTKYHWIMVLYSKDVFYNAIIVNYLIFWNVPNIKATKACHTITIDIKSYPVRFYWFLLAKICYVALSFAGYSKLFC